MKRRVFPMRRREEVRERHDGDEVRVPGGEGGVDLPDYSVPEERRGR
jgi:hypothetical protein